MVIIMKKKYDILPCGDAAFSVRFGDKIDPGINSLVTALADSLRADPVAGIEETVVSYASLLVVISPERISIAKARRIVARRADRLTLGNDSPAGRTHEIPVFYGGEYGEDIEFVAQNAGMSVDDVIRLHTAPLYRVYMIGFMPGFPYLGGLDERIETPRLETPRQIIPAGSVGIGGKQTGVYPIASPGGWRLIGRTSAKLYDPESAEPVLLKAGDMVRFVPIGTP